MLVPVNLPAVLCTPTRGRDDLSAVASRARDNPLLRLQSCIAFRHGQIPCSTNGHCLGLGYDLHLDGPRCSSSGRDGTCSCSARWYRHAPIVRCGIRTNLTTWSKDELLRVHPCRTRTNKDWSWPTFNVQCQVIRWCARINVCKTSAVECGKLANSKRARFPFPVPSFFGVFFGCRTFVVIGGNKTPSFSRPVAVDCEDFFVCDKGPHSVEFGSVCQIKAQNQR